MGEDPEPITGIREIDQALMYNNPVPMLREYFGQRRAASGDDEVIADLERAVASVPTNSAAGALFAGWLERVKRGEPLG